MRPERTPAALGLEHGGRDHGGREHRVESGDGRLGLSPEIGRERDLPTLAALSVEDRPLGDWLAEHLLQAEGLGAELDIVVVPAAVSSPLVFDRVGDLAAGPGATRIRIADSAELDQIGPTVETEPTRGDPETPLGPDPRSTLEARGVRPLMEDLAAAGVLVVDVEAVNVPEGGATIAVQQGIERREWDEVVPLGVGCGHVASFGEGIVGVRRRPARTPSPWVARIGPPSKATRSSPRRRGRTCRCQDVVRPTRSWSVTPGNLAGSKMESTT
jgi:hypothetical protein